MEVLTKKVGFISLGCDKNRVDLEKIIYNISSAGFCITTNLMEANIVIINTCSFILPAREESIETILTTASKKGKGNIEKIIVTGCINEMQYTDLEQSLPEVDAFVNIKDNEQIVEIIYNLYNQSITKKHCFNNFKRILTTPKHYAYLKISDGCNNFCSYCKIPYIRGRYKSERLDNLIIEAQELVKNGAKEIILVAQDVTKYGSDFNDGTTLVTLIRELSNIDNLHWIRLLYCYPESITDDLIKEIRDNRKVCNYIDIPLQHVDTDILKAMNRKNTYEKIISLVDKLRSNVPDISIRSTFILGFPGEKKVHFDKLCNFVSTYRLNQVGFFTYSREEGTRSYDFLNQVGKATKEKRLKAISEIQYGVVQQNSRDLLGKEMEIVVDDFENDLAICRSQYNNPETDSVIYVPKGDLKIGNFYKIKITNYVGYDLEGEIL